MGLSSSKFQVQAKLYIPSTINTENCSAQPSEQIENSRHPKQKDFLNSCEGFLRAKWHLLSPAWNFIFLDQIHTFIWSAKKMTFREFIQNMSKTLSKCLSKWIKVDKWDYLKNPSQELKSSFCLGFLWIPKKTGRQNWRGPIFLRFDLIE